MKANKSTLLRTFSMTGRFLLLIALINVAPGTAGVRGGSQSSRARTDIPQRGPQISSLQYTNFFQIGLASWYDDDLDGNPTASGENYDQQDFTAAHPTLPLGTYVKVTSLENGLAVVVRVNDRGPFKAGRIIDLSHNAARALGFEQAGVQQVMSELTASRT